MVARALYGHMTLMPEWLKKTKDVVDKMRYESIAAPGKIVHLSIESQFEFRLLLFAHRRAPFDLFESEKTCNDMLLFDCRVFVLGDCDELMFTWLNTPMSVVDSKDLASNISREIFVKKSPETFAEILEGKDD